MLSCFLYPKLTLAAISSVLGMFSPLCIRTQEQFSARTHRNRCYVTFFQLKAVEDKINIQSTPRLSQMLWGTWLQNIIWELRFSDDYISSSSDQSLNRSQLYLHSLHLQVTSGSRPMHIFLYKRTHMMTILQQMCCQPLHTSHVIASSCLSLDSYSTNLHLGLSEYYY